MKRLAGALAIFIALPAFAEPAQLKLIAPAEGFRKGHVAPVMVVGLDETNSLADSATMPQIKGAVVTKIVPGIWRADVTPDGTTLALDATLGAAKGTLSAPVRAGGEAVLTVTLSKTLLTPGERAPVTATIAVRDAAGAPLDLAPSLETTVGSASAPARVGPGKYEAKVRLPEERYPQAMQVVAFVNGRDVAPARAVLVLEGRASIPITTKPKSKVTVRIGRKTWGPLQADAHGDLEAEIEAAPSDTSMSVESVDEVGNKSEKPVAIDAPPYPRLWAHAEAAAPALDARTLVRVDAFLLDRRGRPLDDAKASAKIADASLKLPSDAGLYAAEARQVLSPGKIPVIVEAGDEKKTLSIDVSPAPPVAVVVKVTPEQVVAGGAPAGISAVLVDAAGRAVGAGQVSLFGDGVGIGGSQAQSGKTIATASLAGATLPPTASIRAKADGPGFSITAVRPLAAQAGPPAKADILLEPKPMLADGTSVATFAVRFFDNWGNPVVGLKPVAKASLGQAEAPSEVSAGTYKLAVRAPSIPGPSHVTIDAGGAHAETTLTFLRAPSNTSLAGGVGYASNLGSLSSQLLWLEARHAFGGGPWMATVRGNVATGGFTLDAFGSSYKVSIQQEVAQLGVRRLFTDSISTWTISAGLSVGVGAAQVTLKGNAAPPAKGGMLTGGRACATAERRVGGGALVVELGYAQLTGSSTVVKNNVGGADLTVGYRHGF